MAGESHWSGDPNDHAGKDAWDRLTGKGIYYVHTPAPAPGPSGPPPAPPPAPPPPPPPGQIQTHEVVKIPEANVIPTSTYSYPCGTTGKDVFPDIGHGDFGGSQTRYRRWRRSSLHPSRQSKER